VKEHLTQSVVTCERMSEFNRLANPNENCGLAHDSTAKARAVGTDQIYFFWPGQLQRGFTPRALTWPTTQLDTPETSSILNFQVTSFENLQHEQAFKLPALKRTSMRLMSLTRCLFGIVK